MKKSILIIFSLLLTSFTFSQTCFSSMLTNIGGHEQSYDYRSITEANELGVKNIFTTDVVDAPSFGKDLLVRKYDPEGNYIGEVRHYIGTPASWNTNDTHFKDDTLFVIGTTYDNPLIFKISSDLSYIDSIHINVNACPWKTIFYEDHFKTLCYSFDFMNGNIFTKILDIDYKLNIVDSLVIPNTDPYDFQYNEDTLYLSYRDLNGYFFIKKYFDQSIEDFIAFPEKVAIYFALRDDGKILVKYYGYDIFDMFDKNGIVIKSYRLNENSSKPILHKNKVCIAYQSSSWSKRTVVLTIFNEDLSTNEYEFTDDGDFQTPSHLHSAPQNIYIYGKFIPLETNNYGSFIIKSDDPVANAGDDMTIYKGYPPLNTQLNATGGINYSWSPTDGLSDPAISNPIAQPSESTLYTVTVTNSNGCIDTDNIFVEVIDVRCGPQMKKVTLCHIPPGNTNNTQTLCVPFNAVANHLDHGDILGSCPEGDNILNIDEEKNFMIIVSPNPFTNRTSLKLQLHTEYFTNIQIFNTSGALVNQVYKGLMHKGDYTFSWNGTNDSGSTVMAGLYILRISINGNIRHYKLIKN